MSKERDERRDENAPAEVFNSFSSPIQTESRAILSIIRTAPFSPAHRKPQTNAGGIIHMKCENPISE